MTAIAPALAAVLDAPLDDDARLVLADWLEERGDAEWAELIRRQVARSRTGGAPDAAERDLLARCADRVAGRLTGLARTGVDPRTGRPVTRHPAWEIRRGLVERVAFSPLYVFVATFPEYAPDRAVPPGVPDRAIPWPVLREHPVVELAVGWPLETPDPHDDEADAVVLGLADEPWLDRLRVLTVHLRHPDRLRALVGGGRCRALERLELLVDAWREPLADELADEVAAVVRSLPTLRALAVWAEEDGDAIDVQRLAERIGAGEVEVAARPLRPWGDGAAPDPVGRGGVRCPTCATPLPAFRFPRSLRQLVEGGWTCRTCGAEVDRRGRLRAS